MDARNTIELTRRYESSATNTFRLSDKPPLFVRGEGVWLIDENNDKWLDLVCGSSTTNLGHGNPILMNAVNRALATGITHTGTRLPSVFRAELYAELQTVLPDELNAIHLLNSGAEAIECAIKAAQFSTGRRRIVAFSGGYHGRTLGALSVTSGEQIRTPFSTFESIVDILPYSTGSADHRLLEATKLFQQLSERSDLPALLILEAVQGVSGVIEPDFAFLQGIQSLCRQYAVPLVIDEIWNGFGRCGDWFAFQRAGLQPDMIVLGKALSAGLPLSAVAGREQLLKRWPPGMHTSTFQGNPISCAMATASLQLIKNRQLIDHVKQHLEPLLKEGLEPLNQQIRAVADVRVVGAQAAVELINDQGQPDADMNIRLQRKLLQRKILAYGGGADGNCLMLVLPIIIDCDTLAAALETIADTIIELSSI